MIHMTRWACNLLLPSLLWACTTGEKSTLPVSHDHSGTASAIDLDKTVHFTAPDGAPVLAAPDAYLVEQTADSQLRLVPDNGGAPLIVAAVTGTHDLDVSTPFPLVLALNADMRNVVLLLPDGTALDAAGSLSGVQSRDIVRVRRHYQLAYQLNPATGQVQFGEGVMGQQPLAGQSITAMKYRFGAGDSDNVSPDSDLLTIRLQRHMERKQKAQETLNNVLKARDEPFHLEYNTDRPGSDYAQQATRDPESCRAICSADGTCQAFTFVRPPAGASSGQCYLKRTVPTPLGNSCCISAKRKSATEEITGNMK